MLEQKNTPPQLTSTIVMISPDQFSYNEQTATLGKNDFQHIPPDQLKARNDALAEFGNMVDMLRSHDIEIVVLPSRTDAFTPDAVFPNNWFSHHAEENSQDGILVIYPMLTPNRRAERQVENLRGALTTVGLSSPDIVDMSGDEERGHILEGTGSLVLDRKHKIAYALESVRTTKEEFDEWCSKMGYEGVFFHAVAKTTTGNNLYHTNVEMSIGDGFAVLCSDAITTDQEREKVEGKLSEHGELIRISLDQMGKFCGNILQVKSKTGDPKIVMSENAYNAFTPDQRATLEKYGEIVAVAIPTIENVGGGSARCMMAEVFPPEK